MGEHEFVRLCTKSLLYVLNKIWTSIPHRRYTYLKLCPTKESWYTNQSTTPKNNLLIQKKLCTRYEIFLASIFKK